MAQPRLCDASLTDGDYPESARESQLGLRVSAVSEAAPEEAVPLPTVDGSPRAELVPRPSGLPQQAKNGGMMCPHIDGVGVQTNLRVSPMADKRTIKVFIASPGDLAAERWAFKDQMEKLYLGFGDGAGVEPRRPGFTASAIPTLGAED